MGQFISDADLAPFADIGTVKALAMIQDAEAMAFLAAPCLPGLLVVPVEETAEALALRTAKVAATKAILRGAVIRWNEAGSGAMAATSETAGPFGHQQTLDTRIPRKAMFWPSELDQLRDMCGGGGSAKAFEIDTTPAGVTASYLAAPDTWSPW